ncbi:hypothetical protein Tco_0595782 [Tanacetum coccineum]
MKRRKIRKTIRKWRRRRRRNGVDDQWDGNRMETPISGGRTHFSLRHLHRVLRLRPNLSENRTRDAWRENDRATWHYHHLRRWSIMVENLLPPRLRYQEPPYALPETLLAPVTHNDPRGSLCC